VSTWIKWHGWTIDIVFKPGKNLISFRAYVICKIIFMHEPIRLMRRYPTALRVLSRLGWNEVPPTADETDLIASRLKSSSVERSLLRISTFSSADVIL
jgi:hypothetical protein